ncbi:MAG: MlaD family protein [Alphaproteobacteria bacterium]|nr:MlaD family protein [Alphaproteobacteria bacterium]
MSKPANPKVIGAFVIGAIALVLVGLTLLGGGQLFAVRESYVIYFPGSVNGLKVGAAVNFRGVAIGEVTDVRAVYNLADETMLIPVMIEVESDRITVMREEGAAEQQEPYGRLLELGLRAQLQSTSMVTGLLAVNVDFYPGTPVTLVDKTGRHQEIPAIPSKMEQLDQTLTDVMQSAPALMADLAELVRGLPELQAQISEGLAKGQAELSDAVTTIAALADRMHQSAPGVDRLIDEGTVTLAAFQKTLGAFEKSAGGVDAMLESSKEPISTTLTDLQSAVASIERMADQINNLVAENRAGLKDFTDTGLYEVNGLVQDAQRMVDQITRVTEELERDPRRFFLGDQMQGVNAK